MDLERGPEQPQGILETSSKNRCHCPSCHHSPAPTSGKPSARYLMPKGPSDWVLGATPSFDREGKLRLRADVTESGAKPGSSEASPHPT